MARHSQWHISGWPAVLLLPVAIPLAVLSRLIDRLWGRRATADLSPADVAGYIDDFLEGHGKPFDWDDFTSIEITDPALDAIRNEADGVSLPVDDEGRDALLALLNKAKALQAGRP